MISLVIWIGIGVIINFFLQKSETTSHSFRGEKPQRSKQTENILGTVLLVGMKSISGGILSNYIFQSGFGSVDLQTFTILGIAPVLLLIAAKVFKPFLT